MSLIKTFRALRPPPEIAKLVSSVPYDVIYEDEVRRFVRDNPLSFLRITRAEAESAGGPNEHNSKAKENLARFIRDGTLVLDEEPAFFVYRLTSGPHVQTGLVACVSLDEYEKGLIKKHEKTRPDKVDERTAHMLALRAQTGLIFLAYHGSERINRLVAKAVNGVPLYDFVCANGIRQTVWRVAEAGPFAEAFLDVPALYIADGHHRIESALRARDELRKTGHKNGEAEERDYVMAGLFPASELRILAYNRVVRNMEHLTDAEILGGIRENFTVATTGRSEPQTHGEICMYLGGNWYDLELNVKFFREPDPIERLDVSILQYYLLEPVFGIADARLDDRIGFVGGIRGTAEMERVVDSGEARVAFSLYPTTMDDLFAVSDAGEIMPPKSTWFEPKLKDGLFVHLI